MSRYCLEKTNKKKTLTAIDDFFFFLKGLELKMSSRESDSERIECL